MKLQLNFIDVPSAIIPGETILNQIISRKKKAIKSINQIISDPWGKLVFEHWSIQPLNYLIPFCPVQIKWITKCDIEDYRQLYPYGNNFL